MMCDIPHNQNQFLEYKRVYNIGQLVSTRRSGVESHMFQPAVYRLSERKYISRDLDLKSLETA